MNHEVSLVELRVILHSCLKKSEKILKQTCKHRFHRSKFVLAAFEQVRILLGRLLVIFRWKKKAKIQCISQQIEPQISLKISKDDIPKFPPLPPLQKITSLLHQIYTGFPILESIPQKQMLFPPTNFFYQIPFYSKIQDLKITQRHFFLKTSEFTIVGKKSRYGYAITKIDLLWPSKIPITSSIRLSIQRYLGLILKENAAFKDFSLRDPDNFYNLVLSLHNFYSIGQFAFISRELYKYRSDFSYDIKYVNDFELDIFFSEGYQPYNVFSLSLKDNRIIFKSKSTLFMDEPENVNYILEKRKYIVELFKPMKLRNFYEFLFTEFCPSNIRSILTQIRDYLVYTRLMIVFCLFQRSMVCLPFVNFVAKFSCSGPSLSSSSILLKFFNKPCVILTVNHRSGQIIVHNLERYLYDLSIFQNDFGNEITTATQFLKCFVITKVLNFHFEIMGRHFGSLMTHSRVPFFIRDSHHYFFSLSLSFAPDFQVIFIIRPGTPDYYVMTKDFQPISSKKLIEYMNINSINRSISEAVYLNKVLLISLQLEKSLTELGCKIHRNEDRLTIFMKELLKVQVKFKANGYWSLIFHRQFYPFQESGVLTITGSTFTYRMAHQLIGIIEGVQFIKTLMRKAETVCGEDNFYKEHDLSASLVVQGYRINLSMSPSLDHFTIGDSDYFITNIFSPLKVSHDFNCRTFPFPLNCTADKVDAFGAFLNSLLPSLIKFKDVMNNRNWTTSFLTGSDSFYLVYKKGVTLNIQMKPLQYFAVVIPNFGVSSLLQIPLSEFPQFFRLIKLTHHTYKVRITELDILRDRVASFYDDFEMLILSGFNVLPMSFDTNKKSAVMEASFSFRVRANLDVNGLTIMCNDCLILTKLFDKLQKKFGFSDREFYRNAIKHVCSVAKCEHHVASMSFCLIRECLKKNWLKNINMARFFDDMSIDIKNKKIIFFVNTLNYKLCIEIVKKGSRANMVVTSPSNESLVFTDTEPFRHWFKQESQSI